MSDPSSSSSASGPAESSPSDQAPSAEDAAAAAPESATEKPRKNQLVTWGLRLVGVLLLVFVASQVKLQDSITLLSGEVVSGSIEGPLPDVHDPEAAFTFTDESGTERALTIADLKPEKMGDKEAPVLNEGLKRIVGRSDPGLLALGFLMFGVFMHFGVVRWWLLLRAQGIPTTFWMAHKLTYIGMFFNSVVPGATGGDVVKAVYAARSTSKRTEAVMTVLVDRVTGIVALAMIAGIVLMLQLGDERYRLFQLFIFGLLGAVALGTLVFFSRRIRRVLRVDDIAAKLPLGNLIKKADEAAFVYRYQKRGLVVALLLSFANQIAIQIMMMVYGAALHVTYVSGGAVSPEDYLVALPVGFIVSAIPVMPGGWGIREGAFAVCFGLVGVDANSAIALSLLSGVTMLLWSLLGGIYTVTGKFSGNVPGSQAEAE